MAGLATSGILHKGAVAVTSGAMRVVDTVGSETQSIVDDANLSVAGGAVCWQFDETLGSYLE
ncbi:MAG: hypothetical protein ACI4B6_01215 [Atopobiaceae bacterium]